MTLNRDELRTWLRAVLQHMGWSGSDLAKRIDVSPSTINRFLNDPDVQHVLSARNLKKIERATGATLLVFPGTVRRGFAERDGIPFGQEPTQDNWLDAAVLELTRGKQSIDAWTLKSRALEAAGFQVGDVLLVDLGERARARDVVCAQVHDWTAGRADTIFRIYEPPYLIAATSVPDLMKPHLVDDDRVVIMGVVMQSLRPRRSLAAADAA